MLAAWSDDCLINRESGGENTILAIPPPSSLLFRLILMDLFIDTIWWEGRESCKGDSNETNQLIKLLCTY